MKGTVWILLPNCKQNPRLRLLAPSHPFVLALWREGWALLSPPNPESLPRSGVALALPMHPAERRELRAQFCFVVRHSLWVLGKPPSSRTGVSAYKHRTCGSSQGAVKAGGSIL